MSEIMTPHMSDAKIQLLKDSLDRASHYLEYGIGGSTVLAAQKSLQSIIAIDNREAAQRYHRLQAKLCARHDGDGNGAGCIVACQVADQRGRRETADANGAGNPHRLVKGLRDD